MTDSGLYKISTIADRTGFSPTLLRAWERRYGFLSPVRQPSGHRYYTDDDLRVLLGVKRMLDEGRAVGEAAVLGREALLQLAASPPEPLSPSGNVLGTSFAVSLERLLESADALNDVAARKWLDSLFALGPDDRHTRAAVRQLGAEMGRRWQQGEMSVASEHMLSSLIKEKLMLATAREAHKSARGPQVICAGFPDEWHEIGLLFLYYELVRGGCRVTYLGPALPWEDLDLAIARLKPALVCLSVTRKALLGVHLDAFAQLRARHPRVVFRFGGGGCLQMEESLQKIGVSVLGGDFRLEELLEDVPSE